MGRRPTYDRAVVDRIVREIDAEGLDDLLSSVALILGAFERPEDFVSIEDEDWFGEFIRGTDAERANVLFDIAPIVEAEIRKLAEAFVARARENGEL